MPRKFNNSSYIPYRSVSAVFPEVKRRKAFKNAEGANGVGGFGRLVGGWAPFMGATGWGAGGQCPGRQARVLLGGLAQWGHL